VGRPEQRRPAPADIPRHLLWDLDIRTVNFMLVSGMTKKMLHCPCNASMSKYIDHFWTYACQWDNRTGQRISNLRSEISNLNHRRRQASTERSGKAIHAGGLFQSVLTESASIGEIRGIITLRHCLSRFSRPK
jgi:hypothetical protein